MFLVAWDHIEWDERSDEELIAEANGALWIRIASFYDRQLRLLKRLVSAQNVVWKIEYWGSDERYDDYPMSPGVKIRQYAEELFSLGHNIVVYTFTEYNQSAICRDIPLLASRGVHVIPIAQKESVVQRDPVRVRAEYNLPESALVLGWAGLDHPAKGLDEVAEWFVDTFATEMSTFFWAAVVDDGDENAPKDLASRWASDSSDVYQRIRVRVGRYGDWDFMCNYLRAVDVLLVNSVSDSWGRIVTEAMGFGTPVIVRRAESSNNFLVPATTLVDSYAGLSLYDFNTVRAKAIQVQPFAEMYVGAVYSLPTVAPQFFGMLWQKMSADEQARLLDRQSIEVAIDQLGKYVCY